MDGEIVLTVKTNGEGKFWAEDEQGEVVGLAYLAVGQRDLDAVDAVVAHARSGAERDDPPRPIQDEP